MNCLTGDNIKKDIGYFYEITNKGWKATEKDDRVDENPKLENGGFFEKLKHDEGVAGGQTSENKGMPSHLGAFVLSESKRIINHFIKTIDGNKNNKVC